MPWHIEMIDHDGHPVIVTHFSGVVLPTELEASVKAAIEVALRYPKPLVLGDCRTLLGGHTFFDLYAMADILQDAGLAPILKEAVLLSELPDTADKVAFWEVTCANRGFRVRIFTDRDEALAWLIS